MLFDAAAKLLVRIPKMLQIPPPVRLGLGLGERHALKPPVLEAELSRGVGLPLRGDRHRCGFNPHPHAAEHARHHVVRLAFYRRLVARDFPRGRGAAVAAVGVGVEVDHHSTSKQFHLGIEQNAGAAKHVPVVFVLKKFSQVDFCR